MKKIALAVMLTAYIVLMSGISFAQEQVKGRPQGAKSYRTVAYVKIDDNKNKIYLTFLQLDSGKVAAVAKLPKSSNAKIDGMSLKSPSGKKYRAKTMNMRSRDVAKYLQSAYLKQGFLGLAFSRMGLFLEREAEASGGKCDEGTSSAPPDDRNRGTGIGTGILIDTASADKDPWVNVGTFDIDGESGEGRWTIQIRYSDGGLNIDTGGDVNWFHWDDPPPPEPPSLKEQWTEFRALSGLSGSGSPAGDASSPPEFDNFWHPTPAPAAPADFNAGGLLGE